MDLKKYLEKLDGEIATCAGERFNPDILHAYTSNGYLVLSINDENATVYLDVNGLEILIEHLNNILPLFKEYKLSKILSE